MSRSRMSREALRLEATVFCHATENLEKVRTALLNLFPSDLRHEVEEGIKVSMLQGFYGNVIHVLKLVVDKPELASTLLKAILEKLPHEDLRRVEATLEQRIDSSGNLHVRFDKQNAYLGRMRVYDGDDVIKVKVKLSRHALNEVRSRGLDVLRQV
ncbi:MAG: RNA-binding domain-containing protein [Thermofilaceae archaeon]